MCGLAVKSTLGGLSKGSKMDRVCRLGKTAKHMMDSGQRTRSTAKEYTHGLIKHNIMVNLLTTKETVMESIPN